MESGDACDGRNDRWVPRLRVEAGLPMSGSPLERAERERDEATRAYTRAGVRARRATAERDALRARVVALERSVSSLEIDDERIDRAAEAIEAEQLTMGSLPMPRIVSARFARAALVAALGGHDD